MKKEQIIVALLGVLALLTVLPPTRRMLFWVLPLGSGWDDLLFIGLVLAAATYGTYQYTRGKNMDLWWERNRAIFLLCLIPIGVLLLILALMVL